MIDLSVQCGLPIEFDEVNWKFTADESLFGCKAVQRQLDELRTVLYQKDIQGPKELYTLFNNVGRAEERASLSRHGLRYDLGILPPLKLGAEYIKAIGHYHSICPETNRRYGEVYEVVYGIGRFILQRQDPNDPRKVTDVIWTEAREGDRLVMPPDYAHVTINPGPGALVLANIAAVDCSISFSEITQMGGLAYFHIEENCRPAFVRNTRYEEAAPIRRVSLANVGEFGIDARRPIYLSAVESPQKFNFILKNAEFPAIV